MAAIARPLRAYLLAGVAFVLSLGVTAHGAEFDREFGCTDVALFNGLLGHSASDLPVCAAATPSWIWVTSRGYRIGACPDFAVMSRASSATVDSRTCG